MIHKGKQHNVFIFVARLCLALYSSNLLRIEMIIKIKKKKTLQLKKPSWLQ